MFSAILEAQIDRTQRTRLATVLRNTGILVCGHAATPNKSTEWFPGPLCSEPSFTLFWHTYQYTQRFVTVSARRATVWDGKTGEALTTLTSERLLDNDQADITAFSLDHQVPRCTPPDNESSG